MGGIRFEATNTTYSAPQYQLAGALVRGKINAQGKNDYLNVLPGLHLRHQLFKDTPLRISFSRTLARPNYSDLAPFILQDASALTISQGNSQPESYNREQFRCLSGALFPERRHPVSGLLL